MLRKDLSCFTVDCPYNKRKSCNYNGKRIIIRDGQCETYQIVKGNIPTHEGTDFISEILEDDWMESFSNCGEYVD